MNLADFTKGFDMSSIMSDQLRKNFVAAVDLSVVDLWSKKLEDEDFSWLVDLSKALSFECFEFTEDLELTFIVAHYSNTSFLIRSQSLLDTSYCFLVEDLKQEGD